MSQLSRVIGHLAGIDDCRDLGKASVYVMMVMIVMMMIFAMLVIMMVMFLPMLMVMMLIIVVMIIVMLVIMLMMMLMPMQILHVMIMVVLIKHYVEIARIDRRLFHSAHAHFIPAEWKTSENFSEFFLIGAQIEKSGDSHIAADP